MSDHQTLGGLNRDYIAAVQGGDVRRFHEILADDFVCTNPDATFIDRKDLAAHDVSIRIMGDVAIIHARTTYRRPDGAPGAGRWLAVAAHVTRA
jgi:hypothetical protein